MTILDQIATLKDKYPDYWQNPEALRDAMACWGITQGVTDAGMFAGGEAETVARHAHAEAVVRLYEVREGVWVHGVNFVHSQGGMRYAPSVWMAKPYSSRVEALHAGITAILDTIDTLGHISNKADKVECAQLRKQLRADLEQGMLF